MMYCKSASEILSTSVFPAFVVTLPSSDSIFLFSLEVVIAVGTISEGTILSTTTFVDGIFKESLIAFRTLSSNNPFRLDVEVRFMLTFIYLNYPYSGLYQ